MQAYKSFVESGIEELGEITKDQIPMLFDAAEKALEAPDENIQFALGFCRSEKDFLEITPVGKSQYLIWSDRIAPKKGIAGWFGRKRIEKIVTGRDQAIEAALYYWEHERGEFEETYG